MRLSPFAFAFAFYGLVATALAPRMPAQPAPVLQAVPAPETNLAPDTAVMTIGTQTITRAQFEILLAALAENGRPAKTAAQRRQVAKQYADLQILVQEARRRKLDEDREVKQMMAMQSDSVLANALARKIAEGTHVSDVDLRSYYDSHKSDFEEAKVSHILIRFQRGPGGSSNGNDKALTETEALAKAQDLRKKIVAGADFATLAKSNSEDAGSASKGGELGTLRHGQVVPELDRAAFSLPVGEVSEPLRTQSGYELIKVESRTTKTMEEAKPQIEQELKPKMLRDAIAQISSHTAVKLNEAYFGTTPSPGQQKPPVPAPAPGK